MPMDLGRYPVSPAVDRPGVIDDACVVLAKQWTSYTNSADIKLVIDHFFPLFHGLFSIFKGRPPDISREVPECFEYVVPLYERYIKGRVAAVCTPL